MKKKSERAHRITYIIRLYIFHRYCSFCVYVFMWVHRIWTDGTRDGCWSCGTECTYTQPIFSTRINKTGINIFNEIWVWCMLWRKWTREREKDSSTFRCSFNAKGNCILFERFLFFFPLLHLLLFHIWVSSTTDIQLLSFHPQSHPFTLAQLHPCNRKPT